MKQWTLTCASLALLMIDCGSAAPPSAAAAPPPLAVQTAQASAPSGGTMQFESITAFTAGCPSGWTEADFQPVAYAAPSGSTHYVNNTRTCFRTDMSCTVLKLSSSTASLGNCPAGFTEAALEQVGVAVNTYNQVRVCYLCQ